VLWGEQRRQPSAAHVAQQRDGVLEAPVDRRLVSEEAEAAAA
jgi:hypothetical protein